MKEKDLKVEVMLLVVIEEDKSIYGAPLAHEMKEPLIQDKEGERLFQ